MFETIRAFVRTRAFNCCEYCISQDDFSPAPFGLEHIIPTVKDGSTEPDNLAWACQGCNGRKYIFTSAIDPYSGMEAPLFHPRNDTWADHFAWSDDYTMLIGLTPTGRATIERLELNRKELVNLRKILAAAGLHPPSK